MEKKRFSEQEKHFLLLLIEKQKHIVENKETDGATLHQKRKTWMEIQERFNSESDHVERTVAQLQKCWDNIKTKRKKELAAAKRARLGTGGGPVHAEPKENPADAIILNSTNIELEDALDSDTVMLLTCESGPSQNSYELVNDTFVPTDASTPVAETVVSVENETPQVNVKGVLFRQTGLSFIYLLLLLLLPMVKLPTPKTMAGSTGQYLRAVMVLSILTSIAQLSFQIVLFAKPPYGQLLLENNTTEAILRHIGLVRLNGIRAEDGVRYLGPEILMLFTSLWVYIACNKMTRERTNSGSSASGALSTAAILPEASATVLRRRRRKAFFISVGKFLALASLCISGVLRPSAFNGVYFIVFLGAMTWWACYKELSRAFGVVLHCVQVLAALHIMALFVVQLPCVQEFLTSDCSYCRYLGLTFLIKADSSDPRAQSFADDEWASFINPVALLWLYYIIGIESYFLLRPRERSKEEFSNIDGIRSIPLSRQLSYRFSQQRKLTLSRSATNRWRTATQKLIRNSSPSKYEATGRRRSAVQQDVHGSVILTDAYEDNIQLDSLEHREEEEIGTSMCEQILDFISALFRIINRSSYIGTNIIMMVWSITYHSWLTFILLLWANILWILPNQRKTMMQSSPILVMYAEFLLLSQYVYGMNFTNDELPEEVKGVNLAQIGFMKPKELPCLPLLVKSLYTLFFWVTLRQFMQERFERRNTSALEDMAAPLQVTVGPATRGLPAEDASKKQNKAMNWIGDFIQHQLTKFWIWIVAIMLFVIGINGEHMTVYRIIYMALFLIFVLVFQLSYQFWRKFMYGFWLTLIVYSMAILVLIYTYQFDSFPQKWEKIGISEALQKDIGLERYETSKLFIKLLTPTFFVIITVIQMHYFHKDFLAITDIKQPRVGERTASVYAGSSVAGGDLREEDIPDEAKDEKENATMPSLRTLKTMSRREIGQIWLQLKYSVQIVIDQLWLFLELHMLKLMLLSVMLLCVYDVCALHFIFLLLAVIALSFGSKTHMLVIHVMSVLISLLLLVKMIYQINVFTHQTYAVNCTDATGNNAEWVGLFKVTNEASLPYLLKGYIGVIFLATFLGVIKIRQQHKRNSRGQSTERPFIMFPEITRVHADRDVRSCVKYLFNYGFFKFGIEISFMATVALIGSRMDMYAVLYAIWLSVLFSLRRERLAKIWGIYQAFIVMLIPIQYAMAVGLPPGLCVVYPWKDTKVLRRLQEWMFLPDPENPPDATKLICDYILLLFVCRQSLVFRIERRYANQVYAGGSNKSILKEMEQPGFVNPVPDHITYIRSWLDILKRACLSSFLWITLAIVFLAGTNRVNLFSLGYLVGAFVFLWQGEEIYLHPVPHIIRRWNVLIGYNVTVILIKTLLQIVGCMFLMDVKRHACWVAQLLGITCVRKFSGSYEFEEIGEENGLSTCTVPSENSGLIWDGVCFGCLIMMKRLFNSYYFIHQINENKAMTVLASRGAELIEELRMKRIRDQENQEHRILEKIRVKMERIKATQQKIQGPTYKETDTHFKAPLAQSPSMSSPASPQGYHTPIDDDDDAYEEEDDGSVVPPLTPRGAGSLLQAPTPSSAIMTVSLDGYLEPQRMSYSSPPTSELIPRAPSLDADSFPVFSPPPYGAVVGRRATASSLGGSNRRKSSSIGPPWMPAYITPRPSICLSSPQSHHTSIRSGDYYMFEELDDDVLEEKEESSSEDDDKKDKEVTLFKFLDTALKTDMEQATEMALGTSAHGTQAEDQQRAVTAAPIPRNKSSFFTAETEITGQAPASSPSLPSDMASTAAESKMSYPSHHPSEPDKGSEKSEHLEEAATMTLGHRIWLMVKFAWAFVESSMTSLTTRLNRVSRDYRYVMEVLTLEKKALKEKPDFGQGVRMGTSMVWQPKPSLLERSKLRLGDAKQCNEEAEETAGVHDEASTSKSSRLKDAKFLRPDSPLARERQPLKSVDLEASSEELISTEQATPIRGPVQQEEMLTIPEIRVLAPSLERDLDKSDAGSYMQPPVSLEQMDETQELSAKDQAPVVRLILAMWFAIMSHSDLVCYFMVFLYQIKSATILSLPLPLMVFLWGTLTIPRPTKTFWVTMIAYTEVIVIVKWMFQFDFLPWNKQEFPEKNPFFPPRIIGIEHKPNYAMYDLFLLLIVFFHRYMLKSLGLWKSTYEDPVVFKEKEQKYRLEDEGNSVGLVRVPEDEQSGKEQVSSRLSSSVPGLASSSSLSPFHSGVRRRSSGSVLAEKVITQGGHRLSIYKSSQLDSGGSGDEQQSSPTIVVRTDDEEVVEHLPGFLVLSSKRYCDSVKGFFEHLLSKALRVTADVYALMFLCDFFNFMVVIFGFASFGSDLGEGGVTAYLEENKVPIPFLVMLILQFALIVVDRALYLRKHILGKIIFQFLLVFAVHIWMFFILPLVTDKQFNAEIPPQMWYMVKCFYLLLSAYQIRSGYPTRILGNVLCKHYNILNMVLFKGFMAIPFLFELRALMDWMWTDTSMTLWDWLKMEDIFANIFQHKCARHMEAEYPQPRGEKKSPTSKYLMGGGLLFVIIAVIWFPLVLFALGSTVGHANLPSEVKVRMDLSNYEPIYEMSANNISIDKLNEQKWNKIKNAYMKNKLASSFLSNYDHTDVAIIRLNGASKKFWEISKPAHISLMKDLRSSTPIIIKFTWTISRTSPNPVSGGESTGYQEYRLDPAVDGKPNPIREKLLTMLNFTKPSDDKVIIPNIMPKFLKVTNRGMATPVTQLMDVYVSPNDNAYRNLSLHLEETTSTDSRQHWWKLSETCDDGNYNTYLKIISERNCIDLVIFTFNDKSFPKTLSSISGQGILGLYIGGVLVFSKLIRGILTGLSEKIMFTELPNVDRILQLCLDIYLVRESGELDLEEDLFAKLVFLYRSPETLIKWTRPREEGEREDGSDQPMIGQ